MKKIYSLLAGFALAISMLSSPATQAKGTAGVF